MKIQTSSNLGFTLVEIMIVVAIIGLLATIATPNFVRARTQSQKDVCISNLRQIDSAVQTWALENRKTSSDIYLLDDIKPYLKLDSANNIPACPASGTYSPGSAVSNAPTCSLSAAGHALR